MHGFPGENRSVLVNPCILLHWLVKSAASPRSRYIWFGPFSIIPYTSVLAFFSREAMQVLCRSSYFFRILCLQLFLSHYQFHIGMSRPKNFFLELLIHFPFFLYPQSWSWLERAISARGSSFPIMQLDTNNMIGFGLVWHYWVWAFSDVYSNISIAMIFQATGILLYNW